MEVEEHPYEKAAAKKGRLGGPKQTKTGAQHTPDGFRNTLTANKMARLVNRFILENDAYWKPGPDNKYWPIDPATGRKKDWQSPAGHRARVGELKEKYELFVKSWEALIPAEGTLPSATMEKSVVKQQQAAAAVAGGGGGGGGGGGHALATGQGGDSQLFSEMLRILGDGVYISLSCSPSHLDSQLGQNTKQGQVANAAWNLFIERLCAQSLMDWKRIFGRAAATLFTKVGCATDTRNR